MAKHSPIKGFLIDTFCAQTEGEQNPKTCKVPAICDLGPLISALSRMVFFPIDEVDLCASTLLVADVSVGNAGQLAADLLISTLQMERVGFFDDPAVIPVVGAELGGSMCTSMELYKHKSMFVLQQRSAVIPSQAEAFSKRMSDWISDSKFARVVLLSSLSASIRTDRQLADEGYQLAMVCALASGWCRERSGILSWEVLDTTAGHGLTDSSSSLSAAAMQEMTDVARGMLQSCGRLGVDFAVALAFCEEGDNINDGVQVATKVGELLGKDQVDIGAGWKAPASWRMLMDEARQRSIYT